MENVIACKKMWLHVYEFTKSDIEKGLDKFAQKVKRNKKVAFMLQTDPLTELLKVEWHVAMSFLFSKKHMTPMGMTSHDLLEAVNIDPSAACERLLQRWRSKYTGETLELLNKKIETIKSYE